MRTPCPHMVDGQCASPKSSSTVCVLDDPRALSCRILTRERVNHRVVEAPSMPVPHKRPQLAREPNDLAPRPPAASPFDALTKGLP